MADIGAVLRKTIDGLPRNTPQIRAKVYEKGRAAVERQIANAQPPMSPLLAATRRADIEDAIAGTEEHYRSLSAAQSDLVEPMDSPAPPPMAPARPGSTAPVPAMRTTPRPTPAPEPIEEDLPFERAPMPVASTRPRPEPTPEPVRIEKPRPLTPRSEPIQDDEPPAIVVRRAPEPPPRNPVPAARKPVRETVIEASPGFGVDTSSPTLRRPRPKKPEDETPVVRPPSVQSQPRKAPPVAAPSRKVVEEPASVPTAPSSTTSGRRVNRKIVAALLGTVAAVAACVGIVFLTAEETTDPVSNVPVATTTTPTPVVPKTAWEDGKEPSTSTPPAKVDGGDYVPSGPSTTPQTALPGATPTTVPTTGTQTPAVATPAVPATTTQPATTPAPPTQTVTATVTPAPTPAGPPRSVFYEEKTLSLPGTMIAGETAWSLVDEPPEEGRAPEPTIRGVVTVPDRNLTLTLAIRRNADADLPASHLIEMTFATPEGTIVQEARQMFLKPNEKDKGEPLVGIAGKVSDGYFILALNDLAEARARNETLLKTRSWIDIPFAYATGRRALFSLEKGTAGDDVFAKAFDAWAKLGTP